MWLFKEILGVSIHYLLVCLIPMSFLHITKVAVVQRNLGEKQVDRLDDKSFLKNCILLQDAKPYIFDNRLLYHVLCLFSKVYTILVVFLPFYIVLYQYTSEDMYILRRTFEVFQGIYGFLSIDVAFLSFAFIEDKKPRMVKPILESQRYSTDYFDAKKSFLRIKNDLSVSKRKKAKLIYQMEQSVGLLVDYECRLMENTKQQDTEKIDQLFRYLLEIEQECILLGLDKDKKGRL